MIVSRCLKNSSKDGFLLSFIEIRRKKNGLRYNANVSMKFFYFLIL